jgi:type IV pilus assembly protein PilA
MAMHQQHLLANVKRNAVAIASVCTLVFAPASTLPTFAQSEANTLEHVVSITRKRTLKLEFKAKYLQYLLKKNENQGFSWIDLLVVILIFGILAAIVLPGLFSQIHAAKQAEAKNNIGAMNRAQQAYFLEYKKFTDNLAQLRLGIKTETTNYSYRVELSSQFRHFHKFNGKVFPSRDYVVHIAQAKKPQLKSYIGFVGTEVSAGSSTSELLTVAFACQSEKTTTLAPPLVPTLSGSDEFLGCPEGYQTRCKGNPRG